VIQIDEKTFQTFLCMQGRCDLMVTSDENADYTVLIGPIDSIIFSTKINNSQIGVPFKNGDNKGYVIKNSFR
jgi:hypothetical protein